VLFRHAADKSVPLSSEGRELFVDVREFTLEGQRLDLRGPDWRLGDVLCRLLGVFQPGNALLAVAAARALGADEDAIRRGLAAVEWPGRFQILRRDPVVIVDGAHNPAGARALAASLTTYFPGQPLTLVLGVSADKDQAGILSALAPLASRLILTAYASRRAAAPAALRTLLPATGARVETAASLREALALATTGPRTPVICVAGSLYLVGEALTQAREKQDILCGLRAR